MTLIEGADFFIYPVDFPNCANKGAVVMNEDYTYSVYINSRYPFCQWRDIADHELRHILNDDFYNGLDIRFIESA